MKKFLVLILLLNLFFTSCNNFSRVQNQPDSPDFKALTVNLPDFIDSVQIDTNYKFKSNYSNFIFARKILILWHQRIFKDNLLVFRMLDSINNLNFSYWGNKTWHSQKLFSLDSNDYTVDVYATINSEQDIYWELFVTVNQNKQYKFLEGNVYANSQDWTIYKHNIVDYKSIKVEISENAQDEIIKDYYLIDENSDFFGSKLDWKNTDSIIEVNITDSLIQENYKIYFDTIHYFGGICDTVCHCWDENFINSDTCYSCPF